MAVGRSVPQQHGRAQLRHTHDRWANKESSARDYGRANEFGSKGISIVDVKQLPAYRTNQIQKREFASA